jgi:hypothetical protein
VAPPGDEETVVAVRASIEEVAEAIERWRGLDRAVAEARLAPLCRAMADVYAAALLVEAAAWEASVGDGSRKALVARLFVRAHLVRRSPLDAVGAPPEDLERFKELWDGALVTPEGPSAPSVPMSTSTPSVSHVAVPDVGVP